MDLDEDDYEALGYGGIKAYEVLAADMEFAHAYYKKYMREYQKQYRINNRAKLNENKRRTQSEWVKTTKGKAYTLAYRKTSQYKAAVNKRKKTYLAKLKTDPVKWEEFLKKKRVIDKRRKDKKRAAKRAATATNKT